MGRQFVAAIGVQFDAETATGHAQALDFLLDRAGQLIGSLGAQGAQFAGLFLVMTSKGSQFFAKTLDGFVIGIQAFEFFHQPLLQVCQFCRVHTVFAGEGIDAVETFFELLQARGVGVEVIKEAVQLADRFFNLDLCAGDHVGGFAQRLGRILHCGQAIEAGGQGVEYIS
ncbi:hypothetical protein D9M71_562000 [compost metagenome]